MDIWDDICGLGCEARFRNPTEAVYPRRASNGLPAFTMPALCHSQPLAQARLSQRPYAARPKALFVPEGD